MSSSSPSSADQATALLDEITRVCDAATKGDLEPRILGQCDDPRLMRIAEAINSLLDSTDVYVRESTASLQAASTGRYYRQVLERGMSGTFRTGAKLLNGALTDMHEQSTRLAATDQERGEMILNLEHALHDSAGQISRAIDNISEITKNTHVLALNAKIEAARAGDAGRGFAIVAHEVELTSHKVNQVMAEIDTAFATFKDETQSVLKHVAQRKAA
ncbi:MAG: hypothetical protein JST30_12510 [Armatimonadetes bacterium]|nr:hypothetical protein [Armatimonadota bacterium]